MGIRSVNRDDLDTFVNLYKISYQGLEDYAYTRNRDIKHYFRWLMSRDKDGFFIAEIEMPVGFVACDTNWISFFDDTRVGEIHELFVHPEWRGRGIGKELLTTAIEYAKSKNRFLIELWVGETNELAKRFYQKNGFVEKGSWGKWIRMIKKV
ncbi:N-acetyltransferase [Archaeoglobales archaeon]|nr:MAG: N-acetyltransferase [Archaeoglobales archaeon]